MIACVTYTYILETCPKSLTRTEKMELFNNNYNYIIYNKAFVLLAEFRLFFCRNENCVFKLIVLLMNLCTKSLDTFTLLTVNHFRNHKNHKRTFSLKYICILLISDYFFPALVRTNESIWKRVNSMMKNHLNSLKSAIAKLVPIKDTKKSAPNCPIKLIILNAQNVICT